MTDEIEPVPTAPDTSNQNIERILLSPSKREDMRALIAALDTQNTRIAKIDAQLVWLADWCKVKTGIETNDVIGTEGWPSKLVEVIAQAVDARETEEAPEIRSKP